jgi:hypothetical protein
VCGRNAPYVQGNVPLHLLCEFNGDRSELIKTLLGWQAVSEAAGTGAGGGNAAAAAARTANKDGQVLSLLALLVHKYKY